MHDNPSILSSPTINEVLNYDFTKGSRYLPHRPLTTDTDLISPKHGHKSSYFDIQVSKRAPMFSPTARAISAKAIKPGRPQTANTFKHSERGMKISSQEIEGERRSHRNHTIASHSKLSPPKEVIKQLTPKRNYAREIPKEILQDKEALYEESLKQRQAIKNLTEENIKLKTKISAQQKDMGKFEKMLHDVNEEKEVFGRTHEAHFTLRLKKQIKELKARMQVKDAELAEIKMSMKYSKVHESEEQIKAFADEAKRLKTILERVIMERTQVLMNDDDKQRLQEEYFIQATQLKTLKRDNEELSVALKVLEQQNIEYEAKLMETEKKLKKVIQRYKKLAEEKEEKYDLMPDPKDPAGPLISRKEELEKRASENATLLEQLNEKMLQVHDLEKQLRDFVKLSTDRLGGLMNTNRSTKRNQTARAEVTSLAAPSGYESKTFQDEEENYSRAAFFKFGTHGEGESNKIGSMSGLTSPDRSPKKKQTVAPKKKMPTVKIEDVKHLGYEMNLIMRTRNMIIDDVNNLQWPEHCFEDDLVTIKETIQVLKKEPFNIKDNEDVMSIARYLIEEETQEEHVFYDENMESNFSNVKNNMKKFIGFIPRWDKVAARETHIKISDICIKHHASLKENLRALCKSGFLTKRVIQDVCKLVDIYLTEDEIEYIITKLYENSHDIHRLSIESLFEIFVQKQPLMKKTSKDSRSELSNSTRSNDGAENPLYSMKNSKGMPVCSIQNITRPYIQETPLEEEEESPLKKPFSKLGTNESISIAQGNSPTLTGHNTDNISINEHQSASRREYDSENIRDLHSDTDKDTRYDSFSPEHNFTQDYSPNLHEGAKIISHDGQDPGMAHVDSAKHIQNTISSIKESRFSLENQLNRVEFRQGPYNITVSDEQEMKIPPKRVKSSQFRTVTAIKESTFSKEVNSAGSRTELPGPGLQLTDPESEQEIFVQRRDRSKSSQTQKIYESIKESRFSDNGSNLRAEVQLEKGGGSASGSDNNGPEIISYHHNGNPTLGSMRDSKISDHPSIKEIKHEQFKRQGSGDSQKSMKGKEHSMGLKMEIERKLTEEKFGTSSIMSQRLQKELQASSANSFRRQASGESKAAGGDKESHRQKEASGPQSYRSLAQIQSNRETPKLSNETKESRGEIKTVAGSKNVLEKEERPVHKLSFGSVDEFPLERLRGGESIKESVVGSRKIEEPEVKPQIEKLRINLEKANQDLDSNRDEDDVESDDE